MANKNKQRAPTSTCNVKIEFNSIRPEESSFFCDEDVFMCGMIFALEVWYCPTMNHKIIGNEELKENIQDLMN